MELIRLKSTMFRGCIYKKSNFIHAYVENKAVVIPELNKICLNNQRNVLLKI
jgi:hypothetical protein